MPRAWRRKPVTGACKPWEGSVRGAGTRVPRCTTQKTFKQGTYPDGDCTALYANAANAGRGELLVRRGFLILRRGRCRRNATRAETWGAGLLAHNWEGRIGGPMLERPGSEVSIG